MLWKVPTDNEEKLKGVIHGLKEKNKLETESRNNY